MAPPIDTRDGLGVVVLKASDFTEVFNDPALAESSCFAVIPIYLLARDPAVILLAAMAALELVLVPSSVLVGRKSSSVWAGGFEVETIRDARAGVVVVGRIGRSMGVARPWSEYEA